MPTPAALRLEHTNKIRQFGHDLTEALDHGQISGPGRLTPRNLAPWISTLARLADTARDAIDDGEHVHPVAAGAAGASLALREIRSVGDGHDRSEHEHTIWTAEGVAAAIVVYLRAEADAGGGHTVAVEIERELGEARRNRRI